MENFTSSSVKEDKKDEIVCYGVAWSKGESLNIKERLEGKKFQNTDQEDKLGSTSLPKISSFDAKELKIEIVSNSQSMATEKDEFESKRSPGKLRPIIKEVERLEMLKEALEDKVQELKEKLAEGRHAKKKRESYSMQIKNTEKKIEMLGKRIAYEKETSSLPLNRWKSVKTLTKASKSLYMNCMGSEEVLARKMRAKMVLREGKEVEDLSQKTLEKKEKISNKWESRWKELVLEQESDEEMEISGFVFKKPKRTTGFYPPIPDPMAKKRPKDLMRMKESGDYKNSSGRIRLVPNRKRVLMKRAKMYEKQLEFAKKYDLETEDIIANLNSHKQELSDGELAPSVTKQQLHLIGALSEDHVSP
ncbi:uncharacterized protein LOC116289925 [Actinia tenebrosa]|uniref:Uncharacterized protein LOC116289925 n=1 Tax=Actinia tenebrosa TaxID=6105 RepID=A0A6P8HJF8_ACTTE|nr:uncharacterized protein LOC116289925 [Actinia tenebrosa]